MELPDLSRRGHAMETRNPSIIAYYRVPERSVRLFVRPNSPAAPHCPACAQSREVGHVVQFSSIAGRVGGTPGMGAYQTATFAVEGFSEVLANEVKPFGIDVLIVEPGGFRPDWQGSSMQLHPAGQDYDQTVGEFNRMRQRTNGTQPADPARGARVIVDAVNEPQLPRRLLLGTQAVVMARDAAAVRAAELERWADISGTADFPSEQ
jgi:NAD(P)-dependent dehydrogenase (short-subunit alcohol dehydrogenase family)